MYFTELKQAMTANPSHLCCKTSGRQRKDIGRRVLFQQLGPLKWCPGCPSTANRFETCGEGERGKQLERIKNARAACTYHNITSSYVIYIYIYIIFNHICYIIHEYCVHQITLYFVCLCHQLSDFDPFLACIFSQPLSTSAAWLHICWGQIFVGCAAEELHISHVSARHGRDCTPSGVVLWCGMTVRWYPISVPIFQGKKGW